MVVDCSLLLQIGSVVEKQCRTVALGRRRRDFSLQVVLLSNAGFYLGKMLAAGRSVAHVIAVLTVLARRRVRDTGRQLAGSDCAERLLELFFSNEVQGAKELVLVLCEGSTDMRDRMGDARAIRRIVESAEDSATNCKLLAAFAQEAWGRADLRESGALDFLISRLSSTSITSSDRLAIVQPLRHFVHDTNGMAHLVRNRMFIDTVVNDVDEFLATFKFECKAEVIADQDIYRPDSPLLMEIESGLQKKGDSEASSRLHKDYSSLWAYSSPSPARSPWSSSSSPSYSPPSSGAASPVSALSISPFASPHSSHSRLSDLGADAGDGESSIGQGDARHEPSGSLALNAAAEKVIESELWLLNWQAQEDANLPYLGREDVVNAVLSYIALAPSPDYRIGRILRRLACSRHSIDSLLSMQFHTRVLHTLCIVPCRVVRFAKRCGRCERAAEFGREILREFASHVDSDYGDSFLNKRLSSEDFTTRVVAAIAKVALIRDRFRLCRVASVRLPALDLLFDSIRSLLLRNDFIEVSSESTYVDGPPLGAQMVGAISTLISPQRLREILEVDAAVRPQERSECVVKSCGENSDVEMLVFETKEGEVLARVPMQAACESSRYFEGMFTADLFEKCSGQRSFVFNPEEEDCSAEDFTRFLHYMAGCRSLCTAISSAHTCVALVKLSDRYLCPALSDFICSPHGPVRRILTGETLPVFLPAVLTTQTHSRLVAMCLLTLVRYSSSSQVIEALRSICLSPLLVDSFIEQMRILTT